MKISLCVSVWQDRFDKIVSRGAHAQSTPSAEGQLSFTAASRRPGVCPGVCPIGRRLAPPVNDDVAVVVAHQLDATCCCARPEAPRPRPGGRTLIKRRQCKHSSKTPHRDSLIKTLLRPPALIVNNYTTPDWRPATLESGRDLWQIRAAHLSRRKSIILWKSAND